ncbi:protein kinase domain-containing protein, partial [Nitrolancea hollandica]|uniref:protein kinase domain-containing protein n=1 Tax=Nitrolancea hollandica TaxID=1206749 RepID=UPI00126759E5
MNRNNIGGRYDLSGRIGRGGMAEVYLATDRLLGRQVAVKVLDRAFADDAAFVERFKREAQAAAALNHPNVVPIYEWGAVDDTYYIVMGYVPGRNLKEVLRQSGPLPEAEALRIGAQVAAALEEAHRHGIIHRDIKPHNILLEPGGHVVVTDFGIARAAGSSQLTATNVILGTAEYLAPEQAQREPVDGRADLYSLGIVLYELLTGRTPFTGDTMMAIAWQHVHERPPTPRELGIRLSDLTERAVLRAIEKDPAQRYQNSAEMRDALTEARDGLMWVPHPASPSPPSEVPGPVPPPRDPRGGLPRGRTLILSFTALLIVAAVIGLLMSRS